MNGYMTVKEVLSQFPISKSTLYRFFKKGLKKHKFGGLTIVKIDELKGLVTEA